MSDSEESPAHKVVDDVAGAGEDPEVLEVEHVASENSSGRAEDAPAAAQQVDPRVHHMEASSLPVERVTVYNDRAEVTRICAFHASPESFALDATPTASASASAAPGESKSVVHEVVVSGLPSCVQGATVRVAAKRGRAKILEVAYARRFSDATEDDGEEEEGDSNATKKENEEDSPSESDSDSDGEDGEHDDARGSVDAGDEEVPDVLEFIGGQTTTANVVAASADAVKVGFAWCVCFLLNSLVCVFSI
jgi:N-terminal domain of unknown function (DUF4140)